MGSHSQIMVLRWLPLPNDKLKLDINAEKVATSTVINNLLHKTFWEEIWKDIMFSKKELL